MGTGRCTRGLDVIHSNDDWGCAGLAIRASVAAMGDRWQPWLDLVLPRSCGGCGRPGLDWCGGCARALLLRRPRLVAVPGECVPVAAVVGKHEGLLRRAILTHKRASIPRLRAVLIVLMAALIASVRPVAMARGLWRPPLALACVPPSGWHPNRIPMVEVVDPVAGECAAFAPKLLSAARRRRPQKGLAAAARASNVRHAFRADPSRAPPGVLSVVIVDDVITTGASIREAGRAVRAAGLLPVAAVALAQAEIAT